MWCRTNFARITIKVWVGALSPCIKDLYRSPVPSKSTRDFIFVYSVCPTHINSTVVTQWIFAKLVTATWSLPIRLSYQPAWPHHCISKKIQDGTDFTAVTSQEQTIFKKNLRMSGPRWWFDKIRNFILLNSYTQIDNEILCHWLCPICPGLLLTITMRSLERC